MRVRWLALALCAGTLGVAALPRPAAARARSSEKPDAAPALTEEAINGATFTMPPQEASKKSGQGGKPSSERPDPLMIKVQVLLDRARFSPGAIDGRHGDNTRRAIAAYAKAQGLPATDSLDRALVEKLQASSSDPVVTAYTITEADVKGPFIRVPPKLEAQAALKAMTYTNPREMFAERFHMQRDLLAAMNPGKPLDRPGTVIMVAAVAPFETGAVKGAPVAPRVTRIEVDKGNRRVRAYGDGGALVGDYPASIGSEEKPAPSGSTKATRATFDPWYRYNPKYRFKGVSARHPFSIRPGPNNPVGVVWIDLAIPSYGIHGTPEPENIGKTNSHGCIRLTNWDARDLGSHVEKNATVEFLEK
ncbi:L,D-transpeptidase family protein [Methylobacterium haplocladii]